MLNSPGQKNNQIIEKTVSFVNRSAQTPKSALLQWQTCFYWIGPLLSVQIGQKCHRILAHSVQISRQVFGKQDNFSKKRFAGVQIFIYSFYQQPSKRLIALKLKGVMRFERV
jgi:hypothetical protein